MFIAKYEDGTGFGKTLQEAFEDLQNISDSAKFEETTFYEAEEVKARITLVSVITKKKDNLSQKDYNPFKDAKP